MTIYLISIPLTLLVLSLYRKLMRGRVIVRDYFVITPLSVVPILNTVVLIWALSSMITWVIVNFVWDLWDRVKHKYDLNKVLF